VPWLGTLLLVTIACGSAAATDLYRWTEADGSITFSPQRPAAGIAFERVDTEAEPSAGSILDPSIASSPRPEVTTPMPSTSQAPEPRPDPGLSYAPPPLGAATNASADPRSPSVAAVERDSRNLSVQEHAGSSQREERCRELAKRVVSLERRLTTRLSAQDMDDTVLYMARYQQNVERHCRG